MLVPNMKVLTCAVLALSSSLSMAATPEQVIQKANAVRQHVRTNAYRMGPRELALVDQQLTRILRGNTGPGPVPYPDPNPNPYPHPNPYPQSQCRLLGIGQHGGYTYNYRLALNEQSIEASDNLNTILAKIEQYRRDGICTTIASDVLTLSARGNYGGYTYNFRVMLRGEAIAASDNMDTALATLAKLDTAGVGRVLSPNAHCQLLPTGNYGGYTYNYRVGVGSEVMIGTDSYPTATSVMQKLRAASICY